MLGFPAGGLCASGLLRKDLCGIERREIITVMDWGSSPYCDGIQDGALGRYLGHEGAALRMGLVPLKDMRELACSLPPATPWKHNQEENPHQDPNGLASWPWNSQPPELWEYISVVETTQPVMFCASSPSWLKQSRRWPRPTGFQFLCEMTGAARCGSPYQSSEKWGKQIQTVSFS